MNRTSHTLTMGGLIDENDRLRTLNRELVEALEEAVSGLRAFCEGATEHTIAKADAVLAKAKKA
jgi:hypothetical protein